ncbi:hypothetical protein V2L06_20455 [Pseudomonas alliivorans]|nr:hypothetical protein [Pseudomonas alliivorans]
MNKIPEGTQYIESGCGEKGFRKYEKGCWWFFEGYWRHVDWKMGDLIPVSEHPLYVVQPDPWNGEGLPPVGKSVCEYLGANQYDEWSVVNIFAHLDNIVFVEYGNGWRAERDISRFRPIRTAEQIAEDERSDFASQLVKDLNVPPANEFNFYYELGERLHKLGYRKQVTQ